MHPELLMPAGDLEKAKIAYQFGADACYGSTSAFSMRTREIGFDDKTLRQAIDYAHSIDKRFYITLNTYPHEFEIPKIKTHIKKLIKMNPDALIIADPGILTIVKDQITRYKKQDSNTKHQNNNGRLKQYGNKKIELHLSTQANAANSESIKFWAQVGVTRIILPRELSIKEIKEIRRKIPKKIKLEAFVHGAMCNSVSGRCNLSNYLTGRDANRGVCVQACRWKYTLVEEKRPGQYIPVEEDDNGSYIYNSRDLCMIEHLNELSEAGIDSFKIEGRNKSIYYCAIVARAYRQAINNLNNKLGIRNNEKVAKTLLRELLTVTNRGYSTGFYFGKPTDADINYQTSRPSSDWQFAGIVTNAPKSHHLSPNTYLVEARNEILPGTKAEIVTPDNIFKIKLEKFISPTGGLFNKVNPNSLFVLKSKRDLPINSMIRAKLA